MIPIYVVEVPSFVQIHPFPSNPPLRLHELTQTKTLVSKGQVVAYPPPSTYALMHKDL
jgi:tRNA A37 threonylcarbamoyladenosine synthetase subunit TsaC/SUA5/YrdC